MIEKELTFREINQLKKSLPYYLKRYVGAGAYVSNQRKVGRTSWYFMIGNTYPAFVDMSEGKPIIKFLNFRNVGVAIAEKTDDKIKLRLPDRNEMQKKLVEKHDLLVMKAENSLLDITYTNLVQIPNVQVAMNKIKTILLDLRYQHQLELKNYPESERNRYCEYLEFLEDLEYVRKETEGDKEIYVEGNRLAVIKHELNMDYKDELYMKILADVLRRGYEYMSKHLKLLQIVPYIRIINSYYFPSFEFEKLLKVNRAKMVEFFSEYINIIYGIKKRGYKLHPQIEDVVRCDVFEERDDYITGKEKIYDDFLERMYKISY